MQDVIELLVYIVGVGLGVPLGLWLAFKTF